MYVAFAPWFSADCTRSYLAAAKDSAAFLFYVPVQNTTDKPPPRIDQTWNLGDGGYWKSQNNFPVYAIPGADGATIMQQLALYSGNMSEVKNGDLLAQQFNPRDYVRLYTTFGTGNNSNLPTLWAFLLIVLAVVLVLIGATSFSMHYIQRRHRRALQRRVENGEVDLETLGIRRQRLTQAQIETLTLLPYVPNEKKPPLPLPLANSSSPDTSVPTPVAASPQDYNQPTCPICLEDYIPNETLVRSLPCHHIYHPSCIDPFLLGNSSLCPVCKSKVTLPTTVSMNAGTICPPITNAMVRRERHARRLRQRRMQYNPNPGHWADPRRYMRALVSTQTPRDGDRGSGARAPPAPPPANTVSPFHSMELGTWGDTAPASAPQTTPATTTVTANPSPRPADLAPRPQPPSDPDSRREWARRRASALLGHGSGENEDAVLDADDEQRGRVPKCEFLFMLVGCWVWLLIKVTGRKALGSVFPGFR